MYREVFLKTSFFFLIVQSMLKQLMERLNVLYVKRYVALSTDGTFKTLREMVVSGVCGERWTRSRTVVIYLLEFLLEFFEEFYIHSMYSNLFIYSKHFFVSKIVLENNERLKIIEICFRFKRLK